MVFDGGYLHVSIEIAESGVKPNGPVEVGSSIRCTVHDTGNSCLTTLHDSTIVPLNALRELRRRNKERKAKYE